MDKKNILFVGRFPPPVYGTSLMNSMYANSSLINNNFNIKKIKINFSKDIYNKERFNIKKLFHGLINIPLLTYHFIKKSDLVYFDVTVKGMAFYRDSVYILLAKIFRKNILVGFHSKGLKKETKKNKIKRFYYKLVFKNTRAILLSELLYNDIDNLFKKEKVYFNPNGIENILSDKEFEKIQEKREKRKTKKILYLSNMLESKGPLDALKICNLLKKEGLDFECFFAGDWEDYNFKEKWLNYLKEKGLENRCEFLGPKYNKEKYNLMSEIDFIVFPTRYPLECYPLIILEAFMFGIPVYSYDNGAIKEIIDKDYKGYVAKKGDYKKLYEKLKKKINKNQQNRKIRQEFKEKYIFDKAEKRLNEIFSKEIK